MELLVKAGADVNHQDAEGRTPLLTAARSFNAFQIVHYLLEAGANYRLRNIYGRDLAQIVVEEVRVRPDQELGRWREKVVDWLADHGVGFHEVENKLKHRRSAAKALSRWQGEQQERWKRWGAIDAKDAREFRLRGTARLALKDADGAIADITRAVELEPQNAASYKLRGDAWYEKGLFVAKRVDEYEKAIAEYTEALRLDPKWADPYAARAQIYLLEGDYRMATIEYSEAIRLDPNNPVLYWRRADARRWFGYWSGTEADASDAYPQTVADCDKSISIDKFDPRAYHARGLVWLGKVEYDKAIADDSQAIKLDGTYAEAYADRGEAYYLKSLTAGGWKGLDPRETAVLHEKAIQDLSEALRLDPKNAQAHSRRAHVRVAMRDYDKALADFDEVILLDPKMRAYNGRAEVWKAKGDLDRAIADFTEGIRMREGGIIGDISLKDAYEGRGSCWLAKNDYERAIADFTAAGADNKRRDVWSSLGQYEKVIDDLAASIAQDPKNPWNYQTLSLVLVGCPNTKLRDHERAIENAEKACEVTDWRNSAFLDNLAKVNATTENFKDAVKWERKAIELAEYSFLKERYRKILASYEQRKLHDPDAQKK